ncbi:Protein of unknown function [Pyronema omphalodes CBS 100304]|uniref:Uncharacterized protein n=1 Tax=Pyronema omphalodes (strain CBS 100304) TaxID=1076935 RepID=U4LPK6_PYROM|nr:Protein of unknown function [Pyronema omphalodes CBS 100304]
MKCHVAPQACAEFRSSGRWIKATWRRGDCQVTSSHSPPSLVLRYLLNKSFQQLISNYHHSGFFPHNLTITSFQILKVSTSRIQHRGAQSTDSSSKYSAHHIRPESSRARVSSPSFQ